MNRAIGRMLVPVMAYLLCAVAAWQAPATALAGEWSNTAGGGQLWTARYDGPAHVFDESNAVVTSSDGSTVYVTGASDETSVNQDYATVAYDAITGARLWARRYNGPGNSDDTAYAIALSGDGSKVFVTGASYGVTSLTDYATVAYDASTGAMLWAKRYDGLGDGWDLALSVAASPDGSKVFVTGDSYQQRLSDADILTIAYDAATGARLWLGRVPSALTYDDAAYWAAVSPDGSALFVTGMLATGGGDAVTVAYDPGTGTRLWENTYIGTSRAIDLTTRVVVSPDSSTVFTTGSTYAGGSSRDYLTEAIDAATGATRWVRRYNGPANGIDEANALAVSPDGSAVLVTGQVTTRFYGFYAYATVAYEATTGHPTWAEVYEGPGGGDDFAHAVAVSPDGSKVFVTGESFGSGTDQDFATLAYRSGTGELAWLSRFDGPAHGPDVANAIAVSPDGTSVFVTGRGDRKSTFYDFITVAYAA